MKISPYAVTMRTQAQRPTRPAFGNADPVYDSVVKRLKDFIQAEAIHPWMHRPNEAFEGQKPVDMLKTEAGRQKIERMISDLDSGCS